MSDIIHLLPDAVANQIAAGEVIQRPASILKELVENSIDAGAKSIQIIFREAGRNLLQVSDDGKGMSETDARMAFERHATSKISSADDLFSLKTMGFRGEALASIASVAQVELKTKRETDELGVSIEISGSKVVDQLPVSCQKGTTIVVKNLFFNVPARRRFLKSDNVEKTHLLNEFYRIVLVHPDIEFSLYDGDEEIFKLQPANVKIRIDQVFGNARKKMNEQLLSIETANGLVSIRGFIARPEFAQKNAQQYFFVNDRYMRHPYFHKAVMLAYNNLIPQGENPSYFIYFEVDPQTIDVNIHPTKTEIKFEHEQAIWSILSAAIKESLGKFNVVPSIDFDMEGAPQMIPQSQLQHVEMPKTTFNPSYNPFSNSGASTYQRPKMDWEQLYGSFESGFNGAFPEGKMDDTEHNAVPVQTKVMEEEQNNGDYYQLKNRYIITSVKSGMLIVDQRRAHIRVLYDQYLNEITEKQGFTQQLLFPEVLHLNPEEIGFLAHILDDLNYVGFKLSKISEGEFEISGIPSQLTGSGKIELILCDLLHTVMEASGGALDEIHHQIALALAKESAIQTGQKLTVQEMFELMQKLFACPEHNHTPEGKQIMNIISVDEIQKRLS